MNNLFRSKGGISKAQSAGSAAAFIAVLTIMIIMYILFLPPDVREEILNDGTGSGGGSGSGGNSNSGNVGQTTELFRQQVGHVDYLNTNDKVYDLSSVRIYSPTSGQILKVSPSVAIKNGMFDKEGSDASIDFNVDKATTKNVMISFSVKESVGGVRMFLNGNQIYSGTFDTANPKPIPVSLEDLNSQNTLTFKSLDPGWLFWRTNKLTLENIQITGDVTDYSKSESIQYFTMTQAEKNNLENAKFYFTPGCNLNDAGILRIELNNRMIYSSVADCGVRSSASLDIGSLKQGSNEMVFSTPNGAYVLDSMYVMTTFDKPTYNTYFFDMDDEYFVSETERARCGDIDNECPPGCTDIRDADCCFKRNGYWCALPTYNSNDRCSYTIDEEDCDKCPTGFYNKYDDPAKNCEEKCGDNEDGICPSDCPSPSKYYDADCCWEEDEDNFFCQDLPITGLSDKCKAQVRPSDCNLCPNGYEDEDGRDPKSCDNEDEEIQYYEDELVDDYDVKIIVRFVDDTERKRVDINLNGHRMAIDTASIEYTKVIDEYLRIGTNTIEIVPKEDIDIAEITVKLVRV